MAHVALARIRHPPCTHGVACAHCHHDGGYALVRRAKLTHRCALVATTSLRYLRSRQPLPHQASSGVDGSADMSFCRTAAIAGASGRRGVARRRRGLSPLHGLIPPQNHVPSRCLAQRHAELAGMHGSVQVGREKWHRTLPLPSRSWAVGHAGGAAAAAATSPLVDAPAGSGTSSTIHTARHAVGPARCVRTRLGAIAVWPPGLMDGRAMASPAREARLCTPLALLVPLTSPGRGAWLTRANRRAAASAPAAGTRDEPGTRSSSGLTMSPSPSPTTRGGAWPVVMVLWQTHAWIPIKAVRLP